MANAKKVPGLDYLAQDGADPDISAGVIQAIGPNGEKNSMEKSVCRRLFPQQKPHDPFADWPQPTCFHHEVIVPRGTHDDYWRDPQKLCRAYDAATFPGLRDILVTATFRVPQLESSGLKINEYHQIVVGFVRAYLTERGLPTITAIHVPSAGGNPHAGPVHWHCLVAARRWSPLTGPSTFCTDLLLNTRTVLEQEWGQWKKEHLL